MSEQQQREKLTLNIEQKEEFNGTTEIDYKSSNTLAMSINSIFKELFTDYNGCYIEVGNIAQGEIPISVVMDFIPGKVNDQSEGIAAFEQIAQSSDNKRNGSIISGMVEHNQMIDSKVTYVITQDAVDLLYDLLVPGIRQTMKATPKAFQSRGIYVENIQTADTGYGPTFGYNAQQVYHEYVRMIDINILLKAMLPEKNRKGNKVIYDIAPVRSMPNYFGFNAGGQGPSNYLFAISQYDLTAMTNVVREYGRPITNASIQNRFVTI